MNGYKVLRIKGDEKYINVAVVFCKLIYYPHKWIKPLNGFGPLCAFATYEHAKKFIKEMPVPECYPSEYLGIFPCTIKESKKEASFTASEGTILCDAIKIDSSEPIQEGWKITASPLAIAKSLELSSWSYQLSGYVASQALCAYSTAYWTEPRRNCGPLAVFSDESAANEFIDFERAHNKSMDKYSLFKYPCIYIPVSKHKKSHGWTKLWYTSAHNIHTKVKLKQKNFPTGTVLAEKVKLI